MLPAEPPAHPRHDRTGDVPSHSELLALECRGSQRQLRRNIRQILRNDAVVKIYSDAAENFYAARIRPYVTDSLKSFRDPLHLTLFVTDPFILMAWFGLFLCFWPGQRTALLMMFVPFAAIYAVAVYTPISGDNRHAHPLIPIIVVGVAKVADDFFTKGVWARLRARSKPPHAKARLKTGPLTAIVRRQATRAITFMLSPSGQHPLQLLCFRRQPLLGPLIVKDITVRNEVTKKLVERGAPLLQHVRRHFHHEDRPRIATARIRREARRARTRRHQA